MTKEKVCDIMYKSSSDNAGMAQSVEHVIGNDEVISSILITSSKSPLQSQRAFCVFTSTLVCHQIYYFIP